MSTTSAAEGTREKAVEYTAARKPVAHMVLLVAGIVQFVVIVAIAWVQAYLSHIGISWVNAPIGVTAIALILTAVCCLGKASELWPKDGGQ